MHTDRVRSRERALRVFESIDGLIDALPAPSNHRDLLRVHLREGKGWAEAWPEIPAVQLPLLVQAAVGGDEGPAIPMAAACTLLYLGADLFDSVVDRELPPRWSGRDSAEANLAATTLLAVLPQLSIARLREQGTPPARLWALAHLFAETLLTMSAGQYEDLASPNLENISVEDTLTMVARKSGSEYALFARSGAMLALENPFLIEAYTAFGSCLGIARQLKNDVWGIWGESASQDLLNGKRTLPIVYALSSLPGERRRRLRELLATARESAEHHDEVRALLEEAGSVRYTALIACCYQELARDHLATVSPQEPAARELRTLLDQASVLPQLEVV
jgi:geranylgeranyl diphosphate synthase, type I